MHSMRQLTTRLAVRLISKNESFHVPRHPCVKNSIAKVNFRRLSTTAKLHESPKDNNEINETPKETSEVSKQPLGKLEGKLRLMFTCKKCKTRNDKTISKLAYEKGVVIVRCEGCLNNHLIADNLGWFDNHKRGVNIERIMAKKGESIRKALNDKDGYMEAVLRTELNCAENANEQGSRKTTVAAKSSQEEGTGNSEESVSGETDQKTVMKQ